MLPPPQPLPDEVIDRLFSALVVRYGSPFLDRWRDLELSVVKGDWARELAFFGDKMPALRFALDHLPERPPTVIEFRKLCHACPEPDRFFIGNDAKVKTDPERVAKELQRLTDRAKKGRGHRQWAYDLLARHENGQPRPVACVAMAKRAIAADQGLPLGEWS